MSLKKTPFQKNRGNNMVKNGQYKTIFAILAILILSISIAILPLQVASAATTTTIAQPGTTEYVTYLNTNGLWAHKTPHATVSPPDLDQTSLT
jgi:hypothetical protein